LSVFGQRVILVLLFIVSTYHLYAYDLAIVGIYRRTDCSISIKVKNLSDKRIPHKLFNDITIKIYGEIVCRDKTSIDYKKTIKLNDFFMIPNYMSTIDTDLYVDTEENCKTNLKAELFYKDKIFNDDDLTNNFFSKHLTGPCRY
jgi:hypothetical protein